MKFKLPPNLESTGVDDDDNDLVSRDDGESDGDKSSDVNITGLASSIFYIIVIVVVGLPVWFKTTSPSRYSLPDVASLMVHLQTTVNAVDINVVIGVDLDRQSLVSQLPPNHISSDGSVAYKIDWRVRKMTPKEEDVWSKSKSLDSFDQELAKLESHQKPGRIYIFLVDMNNVRKLGKSVTVLGSNRFIYIGVRDEEMSVVDADEDKSLIMYILDALETVLEAKHDRLLTSASDIDEKENIKYLLNREVNLIVNFISEDIEDSTNFKTRQLISDARKLGEEAFIQHSGISNLISINFMSQMVYYGFDSNFIDKNLVTDSNGPSAGNERLFDKARVGLLLNAIESRIVEPNIKLTYHLHVIIPSSSKNSSVYFYDKESKSKSFAAETTYRAGIFFWNKENDFNLAFKSFMRNLLGISSIQPSNSIRRNIFFSQWELDYLMRQMTLQHLAKTLSSLESIDKLLGKLKNIVIFKEIADKMNTAAELSHHSIDLLSEGNLMRANELSGKAFDASESAFYDPSLLSRLYFPEDQKYAVYFPLFLPVSVPLVLSIWHLIRMYYKRKKHTKKD
ncbi:GPI transamidase component PIG-S [Tetranychus urticae]|uniref:GPI transamidase component PIG-S n=1 Tax=Tetranychus urticae TaxID=32264 RepID=T1KTG0_TETUR|nr:GPI transamidase component PIG-S [Tetranychus urticae]